jgi:hypothetical protein
MLTKTNYTVSIAILQEVQSELPTIDSRLVLNQPMGSFFYDPWEIKPEYSGTVWEKILDSVTEAKGEARLIKLQPGEAYPSHADVDDRWHLNIVGNHSYLIDLESCKMYPTDADHTWYLMDGGVRHTAANFGAKERIQLVIRKPLPKNTIKDPVEISLTLKELVGDRRFIFDDVVSPWLNRAYKRGIAGNFVGEDLLATFTIQAEHLAELRLLVDEHFNLEIS